MDLEEVIKEYNSKRPKSKALFNRAVEVIPGGTSHSLRTWGLPSIGAFPYYVERGKGAKIWDVDGHEYIDYWQGHWVNILGHRDERIETAIKNALSLGPHLGFATDIEVKLAELIVEIVPCVEKVRFGVSGSEGTMYAVRIARTYTKRPRICKISGGWHGPSTDLNWGVHMPFTTETGIPIPESGGLPETMDVITIPFNKPDIAKQVIRENANELAGVIVEPLLGAGGIIPAEPGYLEVLREETTNAGVCLIFDEIVTGFNMALGGAQEYFGVIPDLVVLGKTMGGGIHISAVGGSEDIMDVTNPLSPGEKLDKVGMGGGTFSSHLISLSAAYETLSILKREKDKIYPQLRTYGDRMRSRIQDEIISNTSLILKCNGAVGAIGLHFLNKDLPPINAENIEGNIHKEQQMEYFLRMLNQGIHTMHGVGRLCTKHGESEIETTLNAIETTVKALEKST